MKFKTVLLLAAAAILLGLWALVATRSTSAPPPGLEEWNTPLLKGIDLTGLSAVTISRSNQTVSLSLSNGTWLVRNRYGYPADSAKLRNLLANLRRATLIEAVAIEPANLGDLGIGAGQGTRLTMDNASGTPLFTLTAGHVHRKKSDDPSMALFGGFPDGRYILLGNSAYLGSDTLDALDDEPALWLDKEFLSVPAIELASLSLDSPGREGVRLTRDTAGGEWKLDGLPAGKIPDSDKLSRLTAALSSLSFEDLAAPDTPEDTTGFSTGVVCSATGTNGVVYTLQVGNPARAGNRRYVRASIQGPAPLPAEAARQSARVASWIYTMDDYRVEPLLFTRDQLTTDPPKPPTASTPETP